MLNMQTKYFTPTVAELQPFHQIKCQQPNCDSVFMNMGNYELHLQKRHQIRNETKLKNFSECYYYCPIDECIYNFKKKLSGKHFKHMKNLRQHFQKVHSKNYICEHCGDAFSTDGQLAKHGEKNCGKRFKCSICNWDFKTMEALLTHGKRKGHAVTESNTRKIRKTQRISNNKTTTVFNKETQTTFETPIITVVVRQNDTQTQTEQQQNPLLASFCNDNETQTEVLKSASAYTTMLDDMNAIQHDIETQTESTLQHSPLVNSNSSGNYFVGADMHTQTCDAYLLSALGLSDIQTQTNWSSFEEQKHNMYENASNTISTSTSTSTAGFACDELLVSTETQTSFTQCLLESTDMNCDCDAVNNDGQVSSVNGTSTFAHLYNTQHTQTCDLLLDGLFGSQENDLIGGFQSAYTQT